MNKKILVRTVLMAWIVIWVVFLIRPYFKKDLLKDYVTLLTLSAEGKRAHIMGHDLHRFINFSESSIWKPFTYRIVGIEKDSLDHRRAKYYLYPNTERPDPEFILIYKIKDFSQKGYRLFKAMDSENYILEKAI